MTSSAKKLLERMRNSQSSWKRADLDRLYQGFGFVIRGGAKHDIIKHPDYPQLRTTLPRHGSLAKAYVRVAVELIDELDRLRNQEESENGQHEE